MQQHCNNSSNNFANYTKSQQTGAASKKVKKQVGKIGGETR